MKARSRSSPEGVSEWVRKRIALNLAFLEWVAETARLDGETVRQLERLYSGVSRYAALGLPLRDCSPAELGGIAGHPSLLMEETDLTQLIKSAQALSQPPELAIERRILEAWLGRPIKPTGSAHKRAGE